MAVEEVPVGLYKMYPPTYSRKGMVGISRKPCAVCQKIIVGFTAHVKNRLYCSMACRSSKSSAWSKGQGFNLTSWVSGNKPWNKGLTISDPRVKKSTEKMSIAKRLNPPNVRPEREKHDFLVLEKAAELTQQGFRVIPLGIKGVPIPDAIAIKDGKVFSVELERQRPNLKKYANCKLYDDIMWILVPLRRK